MAELDYKKHPIYAFIAGVLLGTGSCFYTLTHIQEENYIRKDDITKYLNNQNKTIISVEEKNQLTNAALCPKETICKDDIKKLDDNYISKNDIDKYLNNQDKIIISVEEKNQLTNAALCPKEAICEDEISKLNIVQNTSPTKPNQNTTKVTTHQGLEHALQSCKWYGEEILCEFIVTNPNSKRTLTVHKRDSFIQDDMSKPYDATWVKIDNGVGEGERSTTKHYIFKNGKARVFIKYATYTKGKPKIFILVVKTSRGPVSFSDITLQ